ncbi:MAG: potassium transporter, partial [Cyanothece sp. SIO2G6]|nr:potassium transporter [Cyanothece sp. SIO2G6]
MMSNDSQPTLVSQDEFLVCGLGSLGQHCVINLKTFGVAVRGIDLVRPTYWEVAELPDLLDGVIEGDCRRAKVLEQAGVRDCRAVLLVTTDERVNLEAALTARLLNPRIRLVIRSDKQNLNDLLAQQLANFVGFEPSLLAAPAFALEAFGEDLLGFFKLGDRRFRVVKREIAANHRWCNKRSLHEIEHRDRRILRHLKHDIVGLSATEQLNQRANPYSPSAQFYTWLPNMMVAAGDVVITVEAEPESSLNQGKVGRRSSRSVIAPSSKHQPWWSRVLTAVRQWRGLRHTGLRHTGLRHTGLRHTIMAFWHDSYRDQIRRVALLCGLTVVTLCLLGTVLLTITGVTPNLADGFYATVVLLLGGYGDLFSDFGLRIAIPWWLRLFSLALTLAGTAFIGVLYALLTEKLLTIKFAFLERRPAVPEAEHVVVIWLGRVGRQVVQLLQDLKQPVVGITNQAVEADVLPQMPLVTGRIRDVLASTNIATAKSVVAVSDDEIQNLELGLLAHRVNPHCRLI